MNRDERFIINMSSIFGKGSKEETTVYRLLRELYGDSNKSIYLDNTQEDSVKNKDLEYKINKLSEELEYFRNLPQNSFYEEDLLMIGDIRQKVIDILGDESRELVEDIVSLIHYYIIDDTLLISNFNERAERILNGDTESVVNRSELLSAVYMKDRLSKLYFCLESFRKVPENLSILSDIKREILPILENAYSEKKIQKIRDLVYSYRLKSRHELCDFKIRAREILESENNDTGEKSEDLDLCKLGRSKPVHLVMTSDKENIEVDLSGLNVPNGMTLGRVEYEDIEHTAIEKVEAIIDEELDGLLGIQITNQYLEKAVKMQLSDLVILRVGSCFKEYMLRPLVELFYSYVTDRKIDKESLKEEARKIIEQETPLGVFTRRAIENFKEKNEEERINETSKILTANRLIELGIRRESVLDKLGLSEDSFDDIKDDSDELLATILYDLGFSEEKIEEILGVQGEEFEEE